MSPFTLSLLFHERSRNLMATLIGSGVDYDVLPKLMGHTLDLLSQFILVKPALDSIDMEANLTEFHSRLMGQVSSKSEIDRFKGG